MMNKRKIGKNKEQEAKNFLLKNNYEIIETNYQTRKGEIDIIAKDVDTICFIEVKYRSNLEAGYGFEAVNKKKQNNIINTAKYYIVARKLDVNDKYRFDVVSIDGKNIRLYKGAFS